MPTIIQSQMIKSVYFGNDFFGINTDKAILTIATQRDTTRFGGDPEGIVGNRCCIVINRNVLLVNILSNGEYKCILSITNEADIVHTLDNSLGSITPYSVESFSWECNLCGAVNDMESTPQTGDSIKCPECSSLFTVEM